MGPVEAAGGVGERVLEPIMAGDPSPAPVRDGFGLRILRSLLVGYTRLVRRVAPAGAIWDVGRFLGLGALEAGWMSVRDEFDGLEQARARHEFEDVAGMDLGLEGSWQAHFLVEQGQALPAAASCPATMALLSQIQGLRGAYFSVMGPGTLLRPHAGPNASILRAHLTLRTPEPIGAAGLEVDGRRIEHRAGEAFVFDDTYLHSAWNRGASERATLMLDLQRPLPAWFRPLDAAVQALWGLHPARRGGLARLIELDAARNG